MTRGKQTCKILKEIRKQIAEANNIEYTTSECKFKGNCLGTCPKCQSEVRYLEDQLNHLQSLGKAIAVAGVALNVISASAATEPSSAPIVPQTDSTQVSQNVVTDSAKLVTGVVLDQFNDPISGVSVRVKGTEIRVLTNIDGYFSLEADSLPLTLVASYLGYEDKEVQVSDTCHLGLCIAFTESDETVMGYIIPAKRRHHFFRIKRRRR